MIIVIILKYLHTSFIEISIYFVKMRQIYFIIFLNINIVIKIIMTKKSVREK